MHADAGLCRGVGGHPIGAGDQVHAGGGFDDIEMLVGDVAGEHLAPELVEDGGDGAAADGVLVLGGAEPAEALVVIVEQLDQRVDVVFAVMLVQDVACEARGFLFAVEAVDGGECGFVHRAGTFVFAYMNGSGVDPGGCLPVAHHDIPPTG